MSSVAIVASSITFLLSLLHIYWGHGGNWPANSRLDLIDMVYGQGDKFPSLFACYIVALLLVIAGVASLQSGDIINIKVLQNVNRWLILGVGFVFGLRGFGGYIPAFEKHATDKFNYYNKRIYSPLCILLSILYILQLFIF